MNKKEKIDQIEQFLEKFRICMNTFELTFADRERDIYQDLEDLEINPIVAEDIIRGLTYKDYEKGPETDRKYADQCVWVFGYKIKGHVAYIKLIDKFEDRAKCLSFHKADYRMKLPYQEKTEE